MGFLQRLDFGTGALNPVEFALMVDRPITRPHAPHDFEIFVGAAVSAVVVDPVAVTLLVGVASTGDDVNGDSALRELVQGGKFSRRKRWGDESGPVGD